MSGRSLVLIDTAREQRSKRRPWQLRGKRAAAPTQGFVCSARPPARDDVPRDQISSKCHRLLFLFPLYPTRRENRPNSRLFLFPLTLVSAWYLYHPCMVTTPWAFPAFQGAHNSPPCPRPSLVGNHSALLTGCSTAPALTITVNLGPFIPRAIVHYRRISTANTHMKAHRSPVAYQHRLTGGQVRTHFGLYAGRTMLLQEGCNPVATSGAPRSSHLLVLNSGSYFFSPGCTSTRLICTSVD